MIFQNYQNLMLLTSSDTRRTLMHLFLFTNSSKREENWFQYVRRVYATAINFPCISTLVSVTLHAKMEMLHLHRFHLKSSFDKKCGRHCRFFSLKKLLFLWISPLFLVIKKCVDTSQRKIKHKNYSFLIHTKIKQSFQWYRCESGHLCWRLTWSNMNSPFLQQTEVAWWSCKVMRGWLEHILV